MAANPRAAAVAALVRQEQDGFSNLVLDAELKRQKLEGRDKAFASAIFYTVLEHRGTLDYILEQFLPKGLAKLDAPVREILRAALAQARYMQVPVSAAVNEAVKLTRTFKKSSASGLVNAVLRKACGYDLDAAVFTDEIQRLMNEGRMAEAQELLDQFNRMMQALIHYSDCGIAKDKLEEIVIGERDIDAPHTALRVIVYKTKQKLAQLGLPGKNLIYLEGGIYYWTPDIEIEEDAAEFEKLYNEACALEKQMPQEPESAETVCDERIKEIEDNMLELYVKALYLYKGEFLAAYTGETWIAQEARRYHTMFEKIINEAAYILRKRKQFKRLEKLGVYAAKVDPFNEWEELIMEAMVETRRYDEAEELYTDVVDYYLRECGIYPSSRLLEILEKYSNQMNHAHEILENIQEGMNEQEETERGGYFCSYPVFKGIYQASIRIMKRTRVPVYLMLCTLEDEEDRQVQSETKINKYSRQLKKCVGESIRYSDIYTSYGKVQFLIMLIGIKREDCEIVKKRINRQFAKKNPRVAEKYHVNSIVCEL